MGARVLLIGLDGADAGLVDRWVEAGRMPTLAALQARGVRGAVAPLIGLSDDAHWASFSTGLHPEQHGRYFHAQIGPDGYTTTTHTRADMTVEPFWDALTRAGQRVAIIDIPKSPLGNGDSVVVADWLAHGADTRVAVVSASAAARELDQALVSNPGFICDGDSHARSHSVAANRAFEQQLEERAALRTRVTRELLEHDDWDLFATVFAETHCVGHRCWSDHDPDHPEHDAARAAAAGDPLERVYANVDACVAELVEAAGPDTTVIAFAPLGMGPNYSGTHLMDEVLRRLEPDPPARAIAVRARAASAITPLRRLIPSRARQAAPRVLRDAGKTIALHAQAHETLRAFPFDLASTAIRISRQGRDPFGRLEDEQFLAVRQGLQREMRRLEDPDTGAPIVVDVLVAEDARAGTATADLYDLLVIWDQTRPITGARSDRIGVVRTPQPRQRSGNHPNGGGWFVVAGPETTPRALGTARPVVDLAPTIAALLGTRLADTEGDVISEVFDRR